MEDDWIENSLTYLNNRPVGLGKVRIKVLLGFTEMLFFWYVLLQVDCSGDGTTACQSVEKHHVVLFKLVLQIVASPAH